MVCETCRGCGRSFYLWRVRGAVAQEISAPAIAVARDISASAAAVAGDMGKYNKTVIK